jgi:hypothetical protein
MAISAQQSAFPFVRIIRGRHSVVVIFDFADGRPLIADRHVTP